MKITKDIITYDEFVVLDEDTNPVTGLTPGNFSTILYDPDKNEVSNISAGISITFEELGDGVYRVSFTPNQIGSWILIVYHNTHFPYGKGANYQCEEYDIEDMVKRILGLSQENYRIFNPIYVTKNQQRCMTSATVKIYPTSADCEADTNVLSEYEITATFANDATMTSYKTKKV